MATPFLGEVRVFAGSFAPAGWALCNGQLLAISQNTALFSLLGTTYGGNGVSTFGLPDLRGRAPLHAGQGAGLSSYVRGQIGGAETVTLATSTLPSHTHAAGASSANGAADTPTGGLPARAPSAIPLYGASADSNLAAGAVASAGGGQPHNNMQPFLTLNFIIAVAGIYPSP
jgi:microcystin-dependent protein